MAIEYEATFKEFGRRLEKLRLERGMTQDGLATEIGISHSYYARIARGRNISLRKMIDISNALGVTLRDLLDF